MSNKKYVPEGVYLACDKGTTPTEFKITNNNKTFLFENPVANTGDMAPMVNVMPFGSCSLMNGNPCAPAPVAWQGFEDGIFIGNFNPLLEDSILPCGVGGKIEIHYSLEDAQAACEEEGWSFWEVVGAAVLVVAAVALIVVSGGAAIAAVGAIAAATTTTGVVISSVVLVAEVAGMAMGAKALYDYSQDGDEWALFKDVALGYLFLGAGAAIAKGFRAWKAARAADEVVEVADDALRAGDELSEAAANQQRVIDDVEEGIEALGTNKRKGNYGEMKMDRHLESVTDINGNPANLTRISDDAVESLDQTIAKGIDGVYENATPPPQYVIAEAKYNTSKLGNPADGPQMSDDWIEGSGRLENAVGVEKADDILAEGYERVLVHIDEAGNVTTNSIDSAGNIGGLWP
ncbi:PAAR-like protein [Aquimarina sp. AU58]|uniref:PAAR-like protein n=1 Tax=Aquimarina sp. AU58 TaxID=1874112 RepID=UPI000D6DFBFB|nr:PAAR-like protein [Aquimarina sp. AU58]